MAKTFLRLLIVLFTIFFSSSQSESFYKTKFAPKLDLVKQKVTHLKLYAHSINGEAIVAKPAPAYKSTSAFGMVIVIDYIVTDKPELSSKQVGRLQGSVALTSQTVLSVFEVTSFMFTQGKYNGSTLSILGRNPLTLPTAREMAIVGGSGIFRFAKGYIETTTYPTSITSMDKIAIYNFHIYH